MSKGLTAGCIAGIVLFAASAVFNIAMYKDNDLTAKETSEKLMNIPLPENTEYIESACKAGKLVGCGNGMQYFGAILVKSELTADELSEYYSAHSSSGGKCYAEQQSGSKIRAVEHSGLSFASVPDSNDCYSKRQKE